MRQTGKFLVLLAFIVGITSTATQKSEANVLKVFLNDSSVARKPYVLAKGSDVNLINIYKGSLTGIAIVNLDNDKNVLTIKELPLGQAVQIGFDTVGLYQITYKTSSDNPESIYKRLLIKVVNVHSA